MEIKNEIVVYQPDEAIRLDVRLENETVWLNRHQMAQLFGRDIKTIGKHIANALNEELAALPCPTGAVSPTVAKFATVQNEGARQVERHVEYYNLDVILSVGYRVKSPQGILFRRWANTVLKDYWFGMLAFRFIGRRISSVIQLSITVIYSSVIVPNHYLLRGYAINQRMNQLENKFDRRLARHETAIAGLKEKVDFFVQTRTPPLRGVFYDGQLRDACSLVEKLLARARTSILLIDNWIGPGTLDLLAKKRRGVAVDLVTSAKGNRLAASDIAKFNAQYPTLAVRTTRAFHDRFLVLDGKELYLIGASLKDLGKKCFGFSRMDAREIPGILARV